MYSAWITYLNVDNLRNDVERFVLGTDTVHVYRFHQKFSLLYINKLLCFKSVSHLQVRTWDWYKKVAVQNKLTCYFSELLEHQQKVLIPANFERVCPSTAPRTMTRINNTSKTIPHIMIFVLLTKIPGNCPAMTALVPISDRRHVK